MSESAIVKEISVAVPCPLPYPLTYTHSTELPPGVRVLIPLGKRSVLGVVVDCLQGETPPAQGERVKKNIRLKSIVSVIDETPIFSPTLLAMGRWLSTYYHQPIGEVFKAMLPAGKIQQKRTTWHLTTKGQETRSLTNSPVATVLTNLFGRKLSLSAPVFLRKCRTLVPDTLIPDTLIPDTRNLVLDSQNSANIADILQQRGLVSAKTVKSLGWRTFSTATAAKEQVPELNPESQSPLNQNLAEKDEGLELSPEQRTALEEIDRYGLRAEPGARRPFLIHGVTGSGKTEVYLQAIAALHKSTNDPQIGPQVLVMVPEISLTPQMTQVFQRRFRGITAVVHSGLQDKERWEQLSAIRSGQASILIGPRSAVFAPFHNLKLIIVDEEHDSSYKQTSNPPYHGRDMAIVRAKLEQAVVVLGSATPSLESYHNAAMGRYRLIRMAQRINQQALPTVEAITHQNRRLGLDIRNFSTARSQPPLKHRSGQEMALDPAEVFSPGVIQAITETLAQGEQGMIIVNRRGFSPFLLDTSNGEVLQCPNCSISLTFHSAKGMARCHYCDFQQSLARLNAGADGRRICAVGHGSQKVELLLQSLFPAAAIVRCDSDSVAGGNNLGTILEDFRTRKIDLLVGTQLLAKGHDFAHVTLIVILEIDGMLHLPDFRAGERAFQLMVQAAGRAGRAEKPGRVLLQTLQPENRIIQAALTHDFHRFVNDELQFRSRFKYPPFSKIALIELNSSREIKVRTAAAQIASWLHTLASHQPTLFRNLRILGPGVPAIARINNHFRRTTVIFAESSPTLHAFLKLYNQQFPNQPSGVRQHLDIDPQSLL